MSHLSSRVGPHWWCIVLQPVACSWGMGPALNCDQSMFRLQLRCSGGTSNLGVDAGLRGRRSFSLHADGFAGWCSPRCSGPRTADGFEGWCSPRCFGPRTASGGCCGDGYSSFVRVSGLRGAYGLQTRTRTAARWP